MDEDWRNAFGILMCVEICDGSSVGLWNGVILTCSSLSYISINTCGYFLEAPR